MNYLIQVINPGKLEILLNQKIKNTGSKKYTKFNNEKEIEEFEVFSGLFDLCGVVKIKMPLHMIPINQKILLVCLKGVLENHMTGERLKFLEYEKIISGECVVKTSQNIPFVLDECDILYDSFQGELFSINYYLTSLLERSNGSMSVKKEILGRKCQKRNHSIKRHVVSFGIEGSIKVECHLNKNEFTDEDAIIGSLKFLVVDVKTVSCMISLNVIHTWQNNGLDMEKIDSYIDLEILDGEVWKGEIIPFRILLKHLNVVSTNNFIEIDYSIKNCLQILIKTNYNELIHSIPVFIYHSLPKTEVN